MAFSATPTLDTVFADMPVFADVVQPHVVQTDAEVYLSITSQVRPPRLTRVASADDVRQKQLAPIVETPALRSASPTPAMKSSLDLVNEIYKTYNPSFVGTPCAPALAESKSAGNCQNARRARSAPCSLGRSVSLGSIAEAAPTDSVSTSDVSISAEECDGIISAPHSNASSKRKVVETPSTSPVLSLWQSTCTGSTMLPDDGQTEPSSSSDSITDTNTLPILRNSAAQCAVCNSFLGKRRFKLRHQCDVCKITVCGGCSPSTVKAEGMARPRRICTPCVRSTFQLTVEPLLTGRCCGTTVSSMDLTGFSGEWSNAINCAVCGDALGKRRLNPRHHCRICKASVCGSCSPSFLELEGGDSRLQRVCISCSTRELSVDK